MFRFLIPTILIGISVAGFLTFTNPMIKEISTMRDKISSYNEALSNAKALENERDKLTKKYNTIDPENLSRLQKLLPDSIDNIRLILEIEKNALPYGMALKDIKYDSKINEDSKTKTNANPQAQQIEQIQELNNLAQQEKKDYGTWELEFSTQGKYSNFINFVKDLENNLRIVDISSITFSSTDNTDIKKTNSTDSYKYGFKIKTYWLKN